MEISSSRARRRRGMRLKLDVPYLLRRWQIWNYLFHNRDDHESRGSRRFQPRGRSGRLQPSRPFFGTAQGDPVAAGLRAGAEPGREADRSGHAHSAPDRGRPHSARAHAGPARRDRRGARGCRPGRLRSARALAGERADRVLARRLGPDRRALLQGLSRRAAGDRRRGPPRRSGRGRV